MSEEEVMEKKADKTSIIVKQCKNCGCLFICGNDMYTDCYRRKICLCNNCEKRNSSPKPCDMKIIRSPRVITTRTVFFREEP